MKSMKRHSIKQYEKGKRYNTERWTPQRGRCLICYWRRAEKYLRKEWRGWAKPKTNPFVDVTLNENKVQCCKEQYCIGTCNVRSMDQGKFSSVQFSSVTQSCPTLWDPMNRSMPGLPVHHQLPEFTQTHVHWVGDAIQPSHPLSSPSPLAPNPSQHQSLFQWVNSSHEVAKVREFQL